MVVSDILQSLFRWIHVVAGIVWIGHLYFFNFVNTPFVGTMDSETKKKVVPQLMPRALFWFRWGAAYTWFSGLLLLMLVFYHSNIFLEDPAAGWSARAVIMILVVFGGAYLYDLFAKTIGAKNQKVAAVIGIVAIGAVVCGMAHWAGFSYRGWTIHIGVMLGTIMAFNVWFRIWPSQKKIITAVKEGQAPDAAMVAQAGLRSRQNTYLSIPLVWTMIDTHTTWASSSVVWFFVVTVFGWIGLSHLYKKAGKVAGF